MADKIETEVLDAPIVEKPAAIVPADEGIEDLKRQLAAEKARAAEAERRANDASQQAYRAGADAEDTNLKLVENAIGVSKGNAETLKSAYADALQAGDFKKAAEINDNMVVNHNRLQRLEEGALAMKAKPKVEPPRPIVVDRVEDLAQRLTPRAATWLRAHPEYAQTDKMLNKMVAAHNLVKDDHQIDSDGYFAAVEQALGIQERNQDDDLARSRRGSPAAVPAGRGGSSGSSGSNGASRTIRLTDAEREIAKMTGQTEEAYAKNKVDLQRQGRLN